METQTIRTELRETIIITNDSGLKLVLEKTNINGVTEKALAQFYDTENPENEIHVGSVTYTNGRFDIGNIRKESPVTEMWEMILNIPLELPLEPLL